ncbi:prevent-host-death protein [uncultured Methylobacterium sp.]|uniref:prevent-host-death protein n=1 Tax=uncultured Methylobacterium sp. TaxID=157278 RepID=UPI0035CA5661
MAEPDRDETATPRRLGVRAFRANLTGFLRQARHGSSCPVTSRGEVLAEIHPPSPSIRSCRQPGALRGKIRMVDDFDALPPDVLAAMEG